MEKKNEQYLIDAKGKKFKGELWIVTPVRRSTRDTSYQECSGDYKHIKKSIWEYSIAKKKTYGSDRDWEKCDRDGKYCFLSFEKTYVASCVPIDVVPKTSRGVVYLVQRNNKPSKIYAEMSGRKIFVMLKGEVERDRNERLEKLLNRVSKSRRVTQRDREK